MSDNDKLTTGEDIDPTVSERYRRLATEQVPDALDHAVLRLAQKAVREDAISGCRYNWFKPAALVFMIALGISLILEINDANILPTPTFFPELPAPMEDPANVFQDAVEPATDQIRNAEQSTSSTIQNARKSAKQLKKTPARAAKTAVLPEDPGCDQAQRSTTDSWLQCIEALENRGATISAAQEIAALKRAFPDFAVPDQHP